MERLTYTVSEVAQLLGVSRSKAYELVAEGQIPVVQLRGRRKLIARATVERLLDPPTPADHLANDHHANDRYANDHHDYAAHEKEAPRPTASRTQTDRESRTPSPHHTVAPGVRGSDPAGRGSSN